MSDASKIEFDPDLLQPQFYMTAEPKSGAELTLTLEELSAPESAERFLRAFADILRAPDLQAAVTYFCSWFSGVAVASLYFPAAAGLSPDFSADNLSAQLLRTESGHALNFVIGSRTAETAPQAEEARDEWTRAAFRGFYGETCRRLFENFAAVSGLAVGMIWAQLPGRVDYFAETWRTHPEIGAMLAPYRERLERDYRLLQTLEPASFGRKKNPFDLRFRDVEHPTDPAQQVRLRPSCCLYHTLPEGEYCYTCPKLNERDRAALRAKQQAQ